MDLKKVGKYDILSKLGEGGFGAVYLAHHTKLQKQVALKVLHPQVASDEMLAAYFEREALALARLEHQNIVRVYDYDQIDGYNFIVMEYVDGTNLDRVLRDRDCLPGGEAVPLFVQLLAALGYAHQNGIVHRDIKPSNIMLTKSGQVKITDFGIAKVAGSAKLTRTGTGAGSLLYMSPEQIRGKDIDNRSDLYSVGVTLFQTVTSHTPFEADTDYEIMSGHLEKEPPPPTRFKGDLPKPLEMIILKSLEKKPDKRYQSAEEMANALRQTAPQPTTGSEHTVRTDSAPFQATRPTPVLIHKEREDDKPAKKSKPKWTYALIPVVVAVIAGIAWVVWPTGEPEKPQSMSFPDSLRAASDAYAKRDFAQADSLYSALATSATATEAQRQQFKLELAASKLMLQEIPRATELLRLLYQENPNLTFAAERYPVALEKIWNGFKEIPATAGLRLTLTNFETFQPVLVDFAGKSQPYSGQALTISNLPAGEYLLRISGKEMKEVRQQIVLDSTIRSKDIALQGVVEQLAQGKFTLTIENHSIFEPVRVTFDGNTVQYTGQPLVFADLKAGSYEIGINTDVGRLTDIVNVSGADAFKVISLANKEYRLSVSAREGEDGPGVAAQVVIDGRKIEDGQTPFADKFLAGPHKIWVEHPDYVTQGKPRYVNLDSDHIERFTLRRK